MTRMKRLSAEQINRLIDSQLQLVDSQRRSLVGGIWLWGVPPETRLEEVVGAPGERWRLVKVEPGDYRGTDPKRALDLFFPTTLLAPGTYVIGVGEGDHFNLAMFTLRFPPGMGPTGEIVWKG